MVRKKEEPQKHFRGVWLSPKVMKMVEDGTISAKEAILIMIIDSLCEHGGKDCWAGNEYLGKRVKSGKRQVKVMISHLKELGLIVQTGFDGRNRFLASNLSEGRKTARQRGGKPPIEESPSGTIREGAHPPGDAECASPPSRNGRLLKDHPRWRSFATQLADAISSVREIDNTSRLGGWATSFYRLHSQDGAPIPEIRQTLKWYCGQIRKGDLIRGNPDYIPVAYSGSGFRKKWLQITTAIQRLDAEDEKDPKPLAGGHRPKIRGKQWMITRSGKRVLKADYYKHREDHPEDEDYWPEELNLDDFDRDEEEG